MSCKLLNPSRLNGLPSTMSCTVWLAELGLNLSSCNLATFFLTMTSSASSFLTSLSPTSWLMEGSGNSAAEEMSLVASLTLSATLELVVTPVSNESKSVAGEFEENPEMEADGRTTVSEESFQLNPLAEEEFQ